MADAPMPLNPAWATSDPTMGLTEPSPSSVTWRPDFALPARASSGPLRRPTGRSAGRPASEAAVAPDLHAQLTGSGSDKESPFKAPTAPADMLEASDAYRFDPAYHEWYYAQHPRDPRVKPPLGNPALVRAPAQPPSAVESPSSGKGDGKPVAHPLAALRKTATESPGNSSQPSATSPAPLGPIAKPTSVPPSGTTSLENSRSIGAGAPLDPLSPPPEEDPQNSAATWIDGLPIPKVDTKGRTRQRRGSNASSTSSKSSKSSRSSRGTPASPLLRQFRGEQRRAQAGDSATSTPKSSLANSGSFGARGLGQTPPPGMQAPGQARGFVGWDLTSVAGHIVEFACDQEGSRLIQSLAEDPFSLSAIFCEVQPELPRLVNHPFGNYCVQRLLELGQNTHRFAVLAAMEGRVPELSVDTYGCRVVQRALECCAEDSDVTRRVVELMHEMDPVVADLVMDQNGNHVVQKLFERLPPHKHDTSFVVRAFTQRIHDLPVHCYGCRVMQKLFETCGDGTRFLHDGNPASAVCRDGTDAMRELVAAVATQVQRLVVDQYGNYVVQHLVLNGSRETRAVVIGQLGPHLDELALQKFSSNAMERLFVCATDQEREAMVRPLCLPRPNGQPPALVRLMTDRYANYVVQKAVELATPVQKEALCGAIAGNLDTIRASTYGAHLLSRLERIGWLPPGSSGLPPPTARGGRGGRGRGEGRGGRGGRGGDNMGAPHHGGHNMNHGGGPRHGNQHHNHHQQHQHNMQGPHGTYAQQQYAALQATNQAIAQQQQQQLPQQMMGGAMPANLEQLAALQQQQQALLEAVNALQRQQEQLIGAPGGMQQQQQQPQQHGSSRHDPYRRNDNSGGMAQYPDAQQQQQWQQQPQAGWPPQQQQQNYMPQQQHQYQQQQQQPNAFSNNSHGY